MKCPVCDTQMKEIEKNAIMIDICPNCKGVWLDRGELDKLLGEFQVAKSDYYTLEQKYHHYDPHFDPYYKKKKKKHAFDIFMDFFD
jgi:Zn-finger nucleic acid-binding protein